MCSASVLALTVRSAGVRASQNLDELVRNGLVHDLVEHVAELYADRLLTQARLFVGGAGNGLAPGSGARGINHGVFQSPPDFMRPPRHPIRHGRVKAPQRNGARRVPACPGINERAQSLTREPMRKIHVEAEPTSSSPDGDRPFSSGKYKI